MDFCEVCERYHLNDFIDCMSENVYSINREYSLPFPVAIWIA